MTKAKKKQEQWIIDCAEENDFEAWSGDSGIGITAHYPSDLIEQFSLADDGMFSIKIEGFN